MHHIGRLWQCSRQQQWADGDGLTMQTVRAGQSHDSNGSALVRRAWLGPACRLSECWAVQVVGQTKPVSRPTVWADVWAVFGCCCVRSLTYGMAHRSLIELPPGMGEKSLPVCVDMCRP